MKNSFPVATCYFRNETEECFVTLGHDKVMLDDILNWFSSALLDTSSRIPRPIFFHDKIVLKSKKKEKKINLRWLTYAGTLKLTKSLKKGFTNRFLLTNSV